MSREEALHSVIGSVHGGVTATMAGASRLPAN